MNCIIIFTTVIVLTIGATKKCVSQHSSFFNDNYGKTNYRFYIPETYENTNPCEVIDNIKFRKIYNQYTVGNNIDVEHIIDLQNSEPELESCNKNIRGNMILADRSWNRGVGGLCWDYVKMEKSQVYGNIFNQAYNNVKKCCGMSTVGSHFLYAVIGFCLTLKVILTILVGIWFYKKRSGYDFDDGL